MPDLRKKIFKYVSSRMYSGATIQKTAVVVIVVVVMVTVVWSWRDLNAFP
jgi:hypothetical protein